MPTMLSVVVIGFVWQLILSPLWGVPGQDETGRSGLSGSMKVGQIAQLVLDDSIAFRVRFAGEPPPQGQLYFRGPVLSDFNGVEWKPLNSDFPRSLGLLLSCQRPAMKARHPRG